MNKFAQKEPWEMTQEEWNAERERIRSSGQGEHRMRLYPLSDKGFVQWKEHFDWLTMGVGGQWIRFRGEKGYFSAEAPKPEDEDYHDAVEVPINHGHVMAEAKRRGLV